MNKGLKLVLFGAGAILTAGVATGIYLAHKDPEYNINKIVKSRNKKEKVDIPHPNLENETFEETFERIFGESPLPSDYPEGTEITTKEDIAEEKTPTETDNFYEVVNMIKEFTDILENNKELSNEEKSKICKDYEEKFKEALKKYPDAYSSYTLKNMISFAEAGDALFDKNANENKE